MLVREQLCWEDIADGSCDVFEEASCEGIGCAGCTGCVGCDGAL